ncbi:MAG: methylmalonyl-CoA epimerase [Alphaproteobacteria bacterium GM7ARS4]|nr:methylmalonyl-CoA epimerase [Alphaproteobacteria bacterium GM7ARS4]
MIKNLNHVAVVVPDLQEARRRYRHVLGARVSDIQEYPDHGVQVVFVELENTKIELLHPLGEESPIRAFLEKHPQGGLHHLCLAVDDVSHAVATVEGEGLRVLGGKDGIKKGAHDYQVAFLHPRDFCGVLLELEQGSY